MASHWGRKETVIWPPQMPVWTYSAIALTLFASCFIFLAQYRKGDSELERSYTTAYVRSMVGAQFKQTGGYRLIYLGGGKLKPRLALPVDFEEGETTLPSGTVVPVQLAELPRSQGYTVFYRGQEQKLNDASLYRWLRGAIFGGRSLFEVYARSFAESGALLVLLLFFSVRADAERFRVMKYGRVLRGPLMVDPKAFNRAHQEPVSWSERFARLKSLPRRLPRLRLRKTCTRYGAGAGTSPVSSPMKILFQPREMDLRLVL